MSVTDCICLNRSPEDYDGPMEDCPVHGVKACLIQAQSEVERLRAELARAEQATAEARLTSVWWAYDDSDYDAWESNALFGDEQHALSYARDAWVESDGIRCEDHEDEPADDCEDCQRIAAYVARLEWRKVANRWELWDKGVEPQWKPSWSGITVAPNKVHWPEALAADVPAAPKPRCTAVNPVTGNMCESVPHWSYYPHWFGLVEQWSDVPAASEATP